MPPEPSDRARELELQFLEAVRERLPSHALLLKHLAETYTADGRHWEGYECDAELIRLCPSDETVWYNFACSCALVGEPDQALHALRRAIRLGYDDFAWMGRDQDLETLHGLDEFQQLLLEGEAGAP